MGEYELYERGYGTSKIRKCMDGRNTGCGKCVGYCQYREHPGFLTKELRKQHDCIGKMCYYYIPKEREVAIKPVKDITPDAIRNTARQILSGLDYMKVVRAVCVGQGQWNLDFVTVSNDHSHERYLETIEKQTGFSVTFRRLDWSFERCVDYICSAS